MKQNPWPDRTRVGQRKRSWHVVWGCHVWEPMGAREALWAVMWPDPTVSGTEERGIVGEEDETFVEMNLKTHRMPPLLCPREVSASMTPDIHDALSCLGVLGERSCWCLSEPRGLLFHTAVVSLGTLAFGCKLVCRPLSRSGTLRKGTWFQGVPRALSLWATRLRWGWGGRGALLVCRGAAGIEDLRSSRQIWVWLPILPQDSWLWAGNYPSLGFILLICKLG